jgi:hypothetical protein
LIVSFLTFRRLVLRRGVALVFLAIIPGSFPVAPSATPRRVRTG